MGEPSTRPCGGSVSLAERPVSAPSTPAARPLAATPAEAAQALRLHFAGIEAGMASSPETALVQRAQGQAACRPGTTDITLATDRVMLWQLARVFAAIPQGKAHGPGGIP